MARLFLGRNALLAIAGAALVGAALGAAWQFADNRAAAHLRLERDLRRVTADVGRRVAAFEKGLHGARGALIAATPQAITRERFRRYARAHDFGREFPGSRGFGFVRRLPEGGRPSFTAAARRDGARTFRIRELAPHDGEHFVIQYIEPEAANAAAVGLDIASEPRRRRAAVDAMASGDPRLTAPITLVQESGKRNRGLLFLLPVYEGAAPPPSEEARLRHTVGWTYAPIIVDELLATEAREPDEPGLRISDVADGAATVLYGGEQAPTALREAATIAMYGRRWQVEVFATPALLREVGTPVWQAALAGGALALLLAVLTAVGLALRAGGARLREHRERLTALVEDSADSIIGVTPAGRVLEWNPAAARMFGWRAEEAVGRSLVDLIIPPERVAEDAFLLARAGAGERITGFETIRRHRGGGLVYVDLNASVLRAGLQGDVIAMTLRDIGERKDAEARLQQQQAALEDQVLQRSEELASLGALQRAILDSASYAIIATDTEGTITLFNPAAEAILGYDSAEVVGRDTPALFHDRAEMAERASRLTLELGRPVAPGFEVFVARVGDGGHETSERTFVARDGTRVPVLLTVTAMRGSAGELLGYVGIAVDRRDALARQEALEVSERKLRGLFELSPVGIALTDARGRFVEFNEAFRALVGYDEDELRQRDYEALTVPGLEAKERAAIEQARRTGRYGPYETQYRRKDGTHVPVRLNGVSLRLNGRLHFWSLVENITGQREVEDAMRQALAAAEGASAAKSDFLANMSHEIRTPMNAILGMLQLLQRSGLQPRQSDYADKADTAARALLGLINDILDFSKIEAGRQVLDPHPFELQPLLHEISVLVSAGIADKDIEVVFDVDPALPPRLVGDAMRLKQVLINLTGNAIKFTAFGEVVVRLRQVADDGERVTIGVEVRDTGIGIAPEHLERIFEGFSQAEASTTRRFGGTGLGLAICRRLVQLMGGELRVDSERGRGSRFHFEVPFERDPGPAAALPEATEAALLAATPGLRVLLVDDNRTARESIGALARALGWSVEAVDSGARALARLEGARMSAEIFDVVFLDWRMPGLDGWETAQRIREHGLHGDAPLVAMVTAQGRELLEHRAETEPSPLDGYLVKPITAAMLAASVHGPRAAAPAAAPEQRPLAAAGTVRTGRLDGLRVLVVEDNPVNQLVVRDLLTGEGAGVEIADGGHAALRALVGEAHRFDVVLMDIQMPGMDGYTATRQIRGRLGIATLPIIAMTANVRPSDRDAALAAGMNDHIGKPFDLDTLVALLQRWTGRAPAVPAAPPAAVATAPAAAPPSPAAEAPVFEPDAAIARFGGRVATFRAALDRFDDDVAARLDAYGKALAGGVHDVAARELHTLKGVSATIGGTRLARAAAEIEHDAPQASGGLVVLARVKRLRGEVHGLRAAIDAWRNANADGAPPATAPRALDPAALQALAALLAESNLRALSVWGELEALVAACNPAAAQAIGEAIGRMDFSAARSALAPMLDRRDATSR